MGIITNVLARLAVKEYKASPNRLPKGSSAAMTWQYKSRVGKNNVDIYRNWARHSDWIRAAIDIRRRQVSAAEWGIVPWDATKPYAVRQQRALNDLFHRPNPADSSFRAFIEKIIEDLLVCDAGCVEKDRNLLGEIVHLWPVDGATIKVAPDWDGSNPDAARYFWYPAYQELASWKNEDFIYIMANPVTYLPVGVSPLETLKSTIEAELYADDYNRRQVAGAAPDGLFDLGEDASPDDVARFRSYFMSEVTGKGAIGFVGGTKGAKWMPLRMSNREMQFLEWETYLVKKIAAVFGMSPQDLGMLNDVNRANGEVQQQNTEDRGMRPLMALLQDYLTSEVVWDRSFGGPANNLAFRFTQLNLRESVTKAQMAQLSLAGTPWHTVNEVRIGEGYAPFGSASDASNPANKLLMKLPQGAANLDEVPSVVELIELVAGDGPQAPEKPAEPPDTAKHAFEALRAVTDAHSADMAALKASDMEQARQALDALKSVVAKMAEQPIDASTTIAEGAISLHQAPVTVEAPNVTVEPPSVTVEAPRPRNIVRETRFEMDERGVITNKVEVERTE